MAVSAKRTWTEALIALAVGVFGLGLIVGAFGFSELRMAVVAGPAVFPYLVGGSLVVLGFALAVELLRGRRAFPESVTSADIMASTGWRGIVPILAAAVTFILTIRWAGLVLSGTVLYLGVAVGFASERWLRDTGMGFAIALLTYLVFNGVLGLRLPGGPFEYVLAR
jgi:putative tricarboxylic transport membrane protein